MESTARARTRTKKAEAPSKAPPAISRESYAAFIGQIELQDIWLDGAEVVNRHGPQTPGQATFRFSSDARWEARPAGFRIFHRYNIRAEAVDELIAEMHVTFGLEFASKEPMTDELFFIFEDVNLPVNTWPFLREFVSTTTGRMGWIPFTLPALKQGVGNAPRPTTSTWTHATRGRKRTGRPPKAEA